MRRVAVITVARSDFTIFTPVLRLLQARSDVELQLVVAGMHLSPEFGNTVDEILTDGFDVSARVEMTVSGDTPVSVAKSIGLGVIGFSDVYDRLDPDIVVVLGDRYEMLAAASALLPHTKPLAHLHGGEATEALIDEAIRHSITKMSHIHYVSTPQYKTRVEQLGEEPWRVLHTGAPSLDNLASTSLLTREELESQFSLDLKPPVLLVTFHPVTLQFADTESHIRAVLAALEMSGCGLVFTCPNADTHGRVIIREVESFVESVSNAQLVANLGTRGYFSLMSHAAAMVGNSSSGIIEAGSLQLPVVNIGDRQKGRVRGPNVIDCETEKGAIDGAIRKALSASFRTCVAGMTNPYGDGRAAERIVEHLASVEISERLLMKRFNDLETTGSTTL